MSESDHRSIVSNAKMTGDDPLLSFLTPTFRNRQLLARALGSLIAQDCPQWELVIAPDDGEDYSDFAKMDPRIRLADHYGAVRTGPGAARNRALASATGRFIACLDDDDMVASNFVSQCMQALEHRPAVLVPSVYITPDARPIRSAGVGLKHLTIAGFADLYATLHAVCRRSGVKPWESCFAEDVLHTCTIIDSLGGIIDVVGATEYRISVRPESLSASHTHIAAAYEQIILCIEHQQLLAPISAPAREQMRALFLKRLAMQRQFEARANLTVDYHHFVMQR